MNYKTTMGPCNEVIASLRPVTSRFTGRLILIALLVAASGSVYAQAGPGDVPENASAKRYGTGWACDRGYREADGACAAVDIPANAYATGSSYGSGWECSRGFRRSKGSCAAIRVPANAYLNSTRGDTWKCDRGFRKIDDTCVAIKVPSNGYLSDSSYGRGWQCDRGFGATRLAFK